MEIRYTKGYEKSFKKLDPNIKNKAIEKICIFAKNPFEKSLRNHALLWKYSWYRSVDITWDYRAIFREDSDWTYAFVDFAEIWTQLSCMARD